MRDPEDLGFSSREEICGQGGLWQALVDGWLRRKSTLTPVLWCRYPQAGVWAKMVTH